jgi:hypothetical protein
VRAERVAVCRLDAGEPIPRWADGSGFVAISRTDSELSVVCAADRVPDDVKAERGYAVIGVEGTLAPELVGVLVSLAAPLADAGIPILAIGTYDTDYVLVRDATLQRAVSALRDAGHDIVVASV